jgi:hypothetical protein
MEDLIDNTPGGSLQVDVHVTDSFMARNAGNRAGEVAQPAHSPREIVSKQSAHSLEPIGRIKARRTFGPSLDPAGMVRS